MEASPCRPAEEAEREGDEKLVFAGAEQSLIWSSGAVFSLSLSRPSQLLSKEWLQGRSRSRRGRPSKSTYLHILQRCGDTEPRRCLAGDAVVILRVSEWTSGPWAGLGLAPPPYHLISKITNKHACLYEEMMNIFRWFSAPVNTGSELTRAG